MESIGTKLKDARDAKGVSIEQAVRDTHMTRRFVEAMEAEDFEQFPGEAYLLGFLRTYASYLGLDGEEIITLYHNIKLQEQPAPIDELLDRKRHRPVRLSVLLPVLGVLIVGGVIALFVTGVWSFPELPELRRRDRAVEESSEVVFSLQEQFVERRFEEGDKIAVPIDGQDAFLELVEISDRVAIGSEAGIVHLNQSERRILDITGEGSADISVSVRAIYQTEGETPAAVVRIDRVVEQNNPAPQEGNVVSDQERLDLALGQSSEPSRRQAPRVIAQFSEIQEYFIEADFRGMTMFRWEIDDQPREERYLQSGERVRSSVENIARIWVSNAGNVRMRVAGNPVELGDQGEVAAVVIRWSETEDGGYQLELLPQY